MEPGSRSVGSASPVSALNRLMLSMSSAAMPRKTVGAIVGSDRHPLKAAASSRVNGAPGR
jgi:hypothetical protein